MDDKVKTEVHKNCCGGCHQFVPTTELKNQVSSQRHGHPTANKVQKRFTADTFFVNIETGEFQKLCLKCQTSVINGFSNGGMFG